MKVIVATINGAKSEYEINEADTVLSLKEKICKDQHVKPEKMRLFIRRKSTGLLSYFLDGETHFLSNDNQSLIDLNYNEGDFFFWTIKFGNDDEIIEKDNEIEFNLNGEEKSFNSHEILNLNYEQFKQKFNIPENEDVEFSSKYNCFKDNHPNIFYKKFNKNINDIGKGEIKCIVQLSDTEEIEVGLPENSTIEDLKLKLFNYYDHLKRPFKLIPLDHIKYSYAQITYSPDKILRFSVDLS